MSTIEKLTREEIERHHAEALPVITPTIKGREALLIGCSESVARQTIGTSHHIGMDATMAGPAVIRNAILGLVQHEYVAFVDDDDVLDPEHCELLLGACLDHNADLAYSWHRTEGATPIVPRVEWGDEAHGLMLTGRNLIPVTVVARREALLEAGGFNPADRYEDFELWLRMLHAGCSFVTVPRETWTYRMLGGNRTWA